jgi:hypothetical protein
MYINKMLDPCFLLWLLQITTANHFSSVPPISPCAKIGERCTLSFSFLAFLATELPKDRFCYKFLKNQLFIIQLIEL